MNIYFHFQKQAKLEERNKLKGFIQSIFKTEKTAFALLNVIFCDDAYLHEINLKYLNHDTLTDIISFEQELHRVIFHGILQFCGYMDKTPGFQKQIRAKEDFYIDKYFS